MNYDCFEYKSSQDPRPLPEYNEARGVLLSVFCRDGFAVAAFAWGCCSVPEELEPKLREMVGKTVAILRLDGKYLVREVA